jgi:hypothetical protein
MTQMVVATVSGSFNRHMSEIERAVNELVALRVHVASPADPRVVESVGGFLFVASDRNRSVRLVQDRHLECIRVSHFLWLVCPDGYVGSSAAMEVGFAAANGVPIFATTFPKDTTLRHYIHVTPTLRGAIDGLSELHRRPAAPRFIVDPHASIDEAHEVLQRIEATFKQPARSIDNHTARKIYSDSARLLDLFNESGELAIDA